MLRVTEIFRLYSRRVYALRSTLHVCAFDRLPDALRLV